MWLYRDSDGDELFDVSSDVPYGGYQTPDLGLATVDVEADLSGTPVPVSDTPDAGIRSNSAPVGRRRRGFFSHSGDEPDFLSNPFNLTVLGFLLSVVGIAHQLIQGC